MKKPHTHLRHKSAFNEILLKFLFFFFFFKQKQAMKISGTKFDGVCRYQRKKVMNVQSYRATLCMCTLFMRYKNRFDNRKPE